MLLLLLRQLMMMMLTDNHHVAKLIPESNISVQHNLRPANGHFLILRAFRTFSVCLVYIFQKINCEALYSTIS